MGSSKSYRGGPSWEARNTPGKATKASKGPAVVKAEGTHMSAGGYGRTGMSKGARKKSSSHKTKPKMADKHGY